MTFRSFALVLAALAAWLPCATARADDVAAVALKQEVAGVELAPLSIGTGASNLGIGGTLRLGRHRWSEFYWTPLQAGIFAGGNGFDKTILAKIQTEVGKVFALSGGALELGFGVGAGILTMQTEPYGCDGPCGVGGKGALLSPVVRYVFRDRPTHTLGLFIRAEVPFGSEGESLVYLRDFGMTTLIGLDLGGGLGGSS